MQNILNQKKVHYMIADDYTFFIKLKKRVKSYNRRVRIYKIGQKINFETS